MYRVSISNAGNIDSSSAIMLGVSLFNKKFEGESGTEILKAFGKLSNVGYVLVADTLQRYSLLMFDLIQGKITIDSSDRSIIIQEADKYIEEAKKKGVEWRESMDASLALLTHVKVLKYSDYQSNSIGYREQTNNSGSSLLEWRQKIDKIYDEEGPFYEAVSALAAGFLEKLLNYDDNKAKKPNNYPKNTLILLAHIYVLDELAMIFFLKGHLNLIGFVYPSKCAEAFEVLKEKFEISDFRWYKMNITGKSKHRTPSAFQLFTDHRQRDTTATAVITSEPLQVSSPKVGDSVLFLSLQESLRHFQENIENIMLFVNDSNNDESHHIPTSTRLRLLAKSLEVINTIQKDICALLLRSTNGAETPPSYQNSSRPSL